MLRLLTKDLWLKGGFQDGDLLYNYFGDLPEGSPAAAEYFALELPRDDLEKEVLCELVKRYLVPALNQPLKVFVHEFSCHNPIRSADHDRAPAGLQPEHVDVTEEQALSVVWEMAAKYDDRVRAVAASAPRPGSAG